MESLQSTTRRALRIAGGGVFIAFAWILLSIVFGLGAGHAHADEADDRGGLLSSLTNGVTYTTGALITDVTDVVSGAAASATDIVGIDVRCVELPRGPHPTLDTGLHTRNTGCG